jgi:centromeric protein E
MRPLKGTTEQRRIWKVLPKYKSVAQTTADGQPVAEKVTGRSFFTFDQTFGETATTKNVYDDIVKDIVLSTVNDGLNGTVFAYGQTSSGKTHTMQGSGTIQEGSAGTDGGIVHLAAADIFQHIRANTDRVYLVRASFLEIYNEEVCDLLSATKKKLAIREDPGRGVFVQAEEEFVTDFNSLLLVLARGEKSRAFASTAMNERSSRSHTIFRVTIESRKKSVGDNVEKTNVSDDAQQQENMDINGDGAVLISTLNLVDLAGSESVRHTGATGDRQKEGGIINQRYVWLAVSQQFRFLRFIERALTRVYMRLHLQFIGTFTSYCRSWNTQPGARQLSRFQTYSNIAAFTVWKRSYGHRMLCYAV